MDTVILSDSQRRFQAAMGTLQKPPPAGQRYFVVVSEHLTDSRFRRATNSIPNSSLAVTNLAPPDEGGVEVVMGALDAAQPTDIAEVALVVDAHELLPLWQSFRPVSDQADGGRVQARVQRGGGRARVMCCARASEAAVASEVVCPTAASALEAAASPSAPEAAASSSAPKAAEPAFAPEPAPASASEAAAPEAGCVAAIDLTFFVPNILSSSESSS